jgi:peptidylglycine monooxygenase
VTDVACCSRGHVFVLLRSDPLVGPAGPAVVELAPDGRQLATWGEDLVADAHMLAIDAQDRLYIVDRDAHEVVVCDRGGRRLGGLGSRNGPCAPFNHPCDVAIAPDGEIYVADGYGNSRVHRFTADAIADGTAARAGGESGYRGAFGEPGSGDGQLTTPHAVWVTGTGHVVVADRENHRLQVFTRDGAFVALWTDHHKPMDIWGDTQGRLYVTDQVPRLSLLSPDGQLLGRCRPVLNGAHGVWGTSDGTLYLAEPDPSRVTRLVPVTGM